MTLADRLGRMLEPLRQRIRMMTARAVVLEVDDSAGVQRAQVQCLRGETRDRVERLQPYGLTSHPLPQSEAVALFIGGNRDHGMLLQVDDRRYRPTGLEPGEVCLYTDQGDQVRIRRGGRIEITASSECVIKAPTVRIEGDLVVEGSVQADGEVTAEAAALPVSLGLFRTAYNAHTHGSTPPPAPQA